MRSSSPTLSYIKPTSFENIKTALSDYRNERFDAIKDQYPQYFVFNWLPESVQRKQLLQDSAYRPRLTSYLKHPSEALWRSYLNGLQSASKT
ncbi:hypothetical protein F5H01DRAFT_362203 [Linnemannia elongata]|nr:hypothetical protein F5H01DRAFT_362203 [Linnemannia elongata]